MDIFHISDVCIMFQFLVQAKSIQTVLSMKVHNDDKKSKQKKNELIIMILTIFLCFILAMFGNDLAAQVHSENRTIPKIVVKCIEAVETRGMDFEGIYRKSGAAGQMRQIQQAFETGDETCNLCDENKWNDICAVTSVLKQYFRDLPNPLFTYEMHHKFIDAASKYFF